MKARPPSFADLRLVCDYLRGLRNEIALDIRTIEMAGLDPNRYGKIPRPSRWIAKAKRFGFLSQVIQYISLPIWYFIGPLWFRHQCHVIRTSKQPTRDVKFDVSGQVLAFSIRTLDIVQPRHIDPAPRQWIEMPWLPLDNLPGGVEVLPALALLDEADLDRSLKLAALAHRILQRRPGMSEWGLQSYTAWRWFLARLVVDKLPGPLLAVEHFDRWAVLVDGSVRQSRNRQSKRHLTIMQHGSVNADVIPRGLSLQLPTRLRAVTHLRAYSEADVEIFKEQILSRHCTERGLEVSFYSPSITLTKVTMSRDVPSILIVGHPLCETAQCALVASLLQKGTWQLFYKPHPTAPASPHMRNQRWTVVEGRSIFPRVDLLISYPSTLVYEYAAHGIPAVVHRMDVPVQDILDRIPEILQTIKSRGPTAAVHNSRESVENHTYISKQQ